MSMEPYSQWREDKWILENLKGMNCGLCVEVGAADGRSGSNTLRFQEQGWAALLIEPNRKFHYDLVRNRAGAAFCFSAVERDGVIETPFYHNHDPFLSGILPHCGSGSQEPVPCQPLRLILNIYKIPCVKLLSIDTEGTELDVWASLGDFPKPDVVIIEWNTMGLPDRSAEILERFTADGYKMMCKTEGNFIFQQRDLA